MVFGKDFQDHRLFSKSYLPTDAGFNPENLSFKTWKRKMILSKMEQAFRSIAPRV
jgi:hypothetical protein